MNLKNINRIKPIIWGMLASSMTLSSNSVHAEDALWEALTGGKPDMSIRLRYENVDDDLVPREANANTARITLGYKTGTFHGFGFYGEVENVTEIFSGDYNHPARPVPGVATVADPAGTEINQAYVFFNGIADTSIKAGRQVITYRKAPFHRFIGTIQWRQNWQTFDALSI